MWTFDRSSKQYKSILESTARINVWDGSVRSGKTIASIVRWLEFVLTAPRGGKLIMAGHTLDTLKRNVLGPIYDNCDGFHYSTANRVAHFAGRDIHLVGASDERSEQKIRGITASGVYGDELTLWPSSFFKMMLSRMSVSGAKLFGTTNPDNPHHWLRKYLDNRKLNLKCFKLTMSDNASLSPEYIADISREYTGLWYQRFILGRWVSADGAIYDSWHDGLIKPQPITVPDRYVVGIDYGTIHATVFILCAIYGNVAHIVREYYHSGDGAKQKTTHEYACDFRNWLGTIKPAAIAVDPAAAPLKVELRQQGFSIIDANNDVIPGIQAISKRIAGGTLYVAPECQNTLEGISGYTWDLNAARRGVERPLKSRDDAVDAMRYAIMAIPSGGIQTVFSGKRAF